MCVIIFLWINLTLKLPTRFRNPYTITWGEKIHDVGLKGF